LINKISFLAVQAFDWRDESYTAELLANVTRVSEQTCKIANFSLVSEAEVMHQTFGKTI
jgi:hypothetical protein